MKQEKDAEKEFRKNICKSLEHLLEEIKDDSASTEETAFYLAIFSCQVVMSLHGLNSTSRRYMQDMMKEVWSEVAISYKDFYGIGNCNE